MTRCVMLVSDQILPGPGNRTALVTTTTQKNRPTHRTGRPAELVMLDAAEILDDLRVPPSNRLEALRGDRPDSTAQHSTRVNQQRRVCALAHRNPPPLLGFATMARVRPVRVGPSEVDILTVRFFVSRRWPRRR
jgi:plasmid maintenance system killer protein